MLAADVLDYRQLPTHAGRRDVVPQSVGNLYSGFPTIDQHQWCRLKRGYQAIYGFGRRLFVLASTQIDWNIGSRQRNSISRTSRVLLGWSADIFGELSRIDASRFLLLARSSRSAMGIWRQWATMSRRKLVAVLRSDLQIPPGSQTTTSGSPYTRIHCSTKVFQTFSAVLFRPRTGVTC